MCKESLMLLIICFILFPVLLYLVINIIIVKDKKIKAKYAVRYFIYVFILSLIPFYKIIDILPFQHNDIERAFKFDYNDKFNRERYGLIFKKKYKNTYFVMGRNISKINNYEIFNCYSKNSNGWRPVIQISKQETFLNRDSSYDIYYCNNKKDEVTGIFVTVLYKYANIKDNLKIEDKYGTEFDYIKNNKGEPITYRNQNNYIYFGIVEQNIDDSYYIKIKNKKIKLK